MKTSKECLNKSKILFTEKRYKKMFINLSTDQVYLQFQKEEYYFNRNDVEKTLPKKLIELANKYDFTTINVLNGPGGFTNLRVGILCLNMMNKLYNERFGFFSFDKITFYKYFAKKEALPSTGIIYIWQRKNIREYDFKKEEYEQKNKSEIETDRKIDEKSNKKIFFDQVYDESYFWKQGNSCKITGTSEESKESREILLEYNNGKHKVNLQTELNIAPEKYLEANYFIQPILGKQWQ